MNKEIFTNENKGFSLVELIVVIAIMAVMTSVLAPSLLGYVEQSRMQKDDSAMGEVMNAIKLALADQDVYDECLAYNVTNNFSCYVDETNKGQTAKADTADADGNITAGNAVIDKDVSADGNTAGKLDATDYWHFKDEYRLDDETRFYAAGNMRGMTITFNANMGTNTAEFKLAEARINDITKPLAERSLSYKYTKPADDTDITLATMQSAGGVGTANATGVGKLYNRLRSVVGDSITLSSQTYRNSEYTVFIRMGSMGGNNAGSQDAVAVYGQWNGTNLSSTSYGTT